MRLGPITFDELKNAWRIILAVVVCQHIGSAISLAFPTHYDWFMNFWVGGALGTFPGFVLGVAWQLRSSTPVRNWIGMACSLGAFAIFMAVLVFGLALPSMRSEMKNLESIKQLRAEDMHYIDVFDRYGREHIARISDTESLTSFAEGIADAVGYAPNHPGYGDSWYVVVDGATRHEFEISLCSAFPQSVIGDFVAKSGNLIRHQGTFKSKGLRQWVDAHLTTENANKAVSCGKK